jgi:hypothetical protein
MEIITQEHLASNLVKSILAELWQQHTNDKEAHESAQDFDDWVYERLADLGEAAYHEIGEMYGDLDGAINEVME